MAEGKRIDVDSPLWDQTTFVGMTQLSQSILPDVIIVTLVTIYLCPSLVHNIFHFQVALGILHGCPIR